MRREGEEEGAGNEGEKESFTVNYDYWLYQRTLPLDHRVHEGPCLGACEPSPPDKSKNL